jgi:cardiolipin synthase A/B
MLYIVAGILIGIVLALVVLAVAATAPLDNLDVGRGVPPAGDPAFLDLVALNSETRFSGSNGVEVLLDGEGTFPRLFEDIRSARRSVTLHLYFVAPGRLADALATALVDRARAGVRVLALFDAFGSELPEEYLEALRGEGVDARVFRPVRWWTLHKAQERSHARIVVIDGQIGYTGGFGIDDRWSARGTRDEPGWRDTNVRVTGPVVASMQAAFAAGWAETAGELVVGEAFYPGIRSGASRFGLGSARDHCPVVAGLLHSRPDVGSSTAERLLALTVAGARDRLFIANAYFVPSAEFRHLLIDAVRRGVDVRILTPSEQTDIPIVRFAGRGFFRPLLDGGVRIWEYQGAMMHAKTFVVDGAWTSIGTLNFDNRSLALNEESALLTHDPDVGRCMEEVFLADLEASVEITPERFARRGWTERVKERVAMLGARLL